LALAACAPTKGETGKFDVLKTDNEDFEVSYIDVGIGPIELAAGDIDGDGQADLVVSNRFSGDLTILTNGLQDSQTLGTDPEPSDVAIADLDGVNGLDLAVVNARGQSVSIFLNDGKGGWKKAGRFDYLGVITQLVAVKLKQDGGAAKDLLFTVGGAISFVVALVNDGQGGFTEVDTEVTIGAGRFVTGLFRDERKYLDLAVLSPSHDTLTILLGTGDGEFVIKLINTIVTRLNPVDIETLDLNDDGIPDLAVSSSTEQHVSIYEGKGIDGVFTLDVEKKILGGGEALVTGAFDSATDGHQNDIAIANRNHRVITTLLWDHLKRNFDEHHIQVHQGPFAIVKGDFNVDGCTDLAVAESDLRAISILAGDCKGEFTHTTIGFSSAPGVPLVLDLDGDGGEDIVAVQPRDQKVVVLRNVH
jgi:hypothetical protein